MYLTTGFRQPEAAKLYLKSGYRALFDVTADPETIQILPFEKTLAPAGVHPAPRNDHLSAPVA